MDRRLLCLPLLALLAAGCGGRGAATSGSQNLTVHFAWPAMSARLIPAASASVKVVVTQGGTTYGAVTLVNPTTTATLVDMPLGIVNVTASAYPTAAATGTVMASATTTTTVTANGTASVDLTMASTVTRLAISPSTVTLALHNLITQQLTVTAYDASNAVVLSSSADYAYATTNSLLFNVSATGLVTGLAVGNATVTATHRDSGISASAGIQIGL